MSRRDIIFIKFEIYIFKLISIFNLLQVFDLTVVSILYSAQFTSINFLSEGYKYMSWKNISSILMFLILFISADVFSAECRISRNVSTAPISWDNNQPVINSQLSRINPERCLAPPGSFITNTRIAFNFQSRASVLPDGLVFGDYSVSIFSSRGDVSVTPASVRTENVVGITNSGSTSALNGIDINGFSFNVFGRIRNSANVTCSSSSPSECEDYIRAGYTIVFEYDDPLATPPRPSSVSAVLNSDDITISWSNVSDAEFYEREVSLNGGDWYKRQTYNQPQTSVTFSNQRPRTYRYRVRACNTNGCSDWTLSNSLTVLNPPASVSASISGGDDVTISWSNVSGATHYNREVRINGDSWINRTTYNQPQTSVVFANQRSRSYEYRVRACNDDGCSAWRQSNRITVN